MMAAAGTEKALKLAAALVFSFSLAGQAPANGKLCEREMMRAAEEHGVPVGMLYAVGLTETGRGESLHPYAMNIEGKASFDARPQEAIARFQVAQAAGIKLIDVGCMQINHHYHRDKFASVEQMFEPAANVDYAARFLKELKAREGTWTMAVARYHAGPDNDPAQKRYICRVIANMVATGFGAWTPQSRALCAPAATARAPKAERLTTR
jgi:soluble lytic murein transglycosylase-like protein